jgi:hypothetical protein
MPLRVNFRREFMINSLLGAEYHSDMFSMIGTVFLWMFWPSFNSAPGSDVDRYYAICNTYLALSAACVSTFIFSILFNPKRRITMGKGLKLSKRIIGYPVRSSLNLFMTSQSKPSLIPLKNTSRTPLSPVVWLWARPPTCRSSLLPRFSSDSPPDCSLLLATATSRYYEILRVSLLMTRSPSSLKRFRCMILAVSTICTACPPSWPPFSQLSTAESTTTYK